MKRNPTNSPPRTLFFCLGQGQIFKMGCQTWMPLELTKWKWVGHDGQALYPGNRSKNAAKSQTKPMGSNMVDPQTMLQELKRRRRHPSTSTRSGFNCGSVVMLRLNPIGTLYLEKLRWNVAQQLRQLGRAHFLVQGQKTMRHSTQ